MCYVIDMHVLLSLFFDKWGVCLLYHRYYVHVPLSLKKPYVPGTFVIDCSKVLDYCTFCMSFYGEMYQGNLAT